MTNENRVEQQAAYVLHQRAYRDTSAIVDVFTRDFGRVSLLAKGIKTKKKNAAALQPFVSLSIAWQGKGELKTLTSTEQQHNPPAFSQSTLISALYLNELLLRLLPKFDPMESLFDEYSKTLHYFYQSLPLEPLLRNFEKRLLESLGYELNLCVEANTGETIEENKRYYFFPDQGPVKASIESVGERRSYSGRSLLAFADDNYSDKETMEAAKQITRSALQPLLGTKPLKTRELFASFRSTTKPKA